MKPGLHGAHVWRRVLGPCVAGCAAAAIACSESPDVEPGYWPEVIDVRRTRVDVFEHMPLVEPHLAVYFDTSFGISLQAVAIHFTDTPRDGRDSAPDMFAMPGTFSCVAMESMNEGDSWQEVALPRVRSCGDPWIAAGSAEMALVYSDAGGGAEGGMTLLRRQRIGSGWGAWTVISRRAGSFDHPTVTMLNGGMAVVAAPLRGPVNVFVTRSNGDSLHAAALGDAAVNQSGNPAVVVGDSLIIVPFTDYEVSYVRRSRDGGKSWEPAARVTDRCSDPFQQLAHATHLYFVCGGDSDSLFLFESADSGSTWLPRWTLPDAAAGARGTARGTPSVVALDGGAVAIVWQELSASGCRELRAAFAAAGGEVGGEVLLSGTPQCGRADTLSFLGRRFPFGGAYVGVASLRSTFYVLWPAPSGSGGFQLEFVRVKTAGR